MKKFTNSFFFHRGNNLAVLQIKLYKVQLDFQNMTNYTIQGFPPLN